MSVRIPFTGLRALARDGGGATVVEFAIVAPVMCLLLVGAFDISHTLYMRGALQGVVQKVARDSTLESGLEAAVQTKLDNRVRAQVHAIANNSTVTFTREYYRTFSAAAKGQYEPFTDTNGNGTCDGPQGSTPGEPYEDTNNSGFWDRGVKTGQGGAKDAVLYTVRVSYPRMFPLNRLIGGSDTTVVKASTVLRNQPYADQAGAAPKNCP